MSEVDIDTFARAHAEGAEVIDVREPQEYLAGHVPGAKLIPMAQLPGGTGSWARAGRPIIQGRERG